MPLVGVPLDQPVGLALALELGLFSMCFESLQVVRDRDDDAEAGLETTAVRFGRAWTLRLAKVAILLATFFAGDDVDLLDPGGTVVGRGLVNFDADELPALLGRSTRDLKEALGSAYEREVIHRDDLVLL